MSVRRVGVIMNGVAGRMGRNQHLQRAILAIRDSGGVQIGPDETIVPDPILVGRSADKLRGLARRFDIEQYTTNLDGVLSDDNFPVYFDSVATQARAANLRKAIAAGKHVYTEKPTATTTADALALAEQAEAAGVKHGVVQDKLWLPGLMKLRYLVETGFFGRILSVEGRFGYFVFDGLRQPAQRPSWNYRREEGGGIIFDMFCHWRYLIDGLFGKIKSLVAHGAVHIPDRADERGQRYEATAEDAAYAIFQLESGLPVQFNSSWVTRVRRDDLLTIQVDGTDGSAVAGLRDCRIQPDACTPRPVWNPDVDQSIDFFAGWQNMPSHADYGNAFRVQWELFLEHVVCDAPFRWGLLEGAKGVQLAELGLRSWQERRWVDVPELR